MKKPTLLQYIIMFIIFELGFVGIGLLALHQWSTQGGI